ncbi:unnamed protein product [Clonostachys rosea f. rosea IK726]|uniref:Uncharacterized protein n=1 Tax=Clonostachys rosea f. rosea IK726 TaxID=1349383 RepID=A0ACA9UDN1_BIOOC|nr:unnamed protein product [Clonostachys rosea f. rosea IK726]
MPDSHGQIWMQLVSIASQAGDGDAIANSSSRDGSSDISDPPIVDHKFAESLRLGSEQRFPTWRLVTLWYQSGGGRWLRDGARQEWGLVVGEPPHRRVLVPAVGLDARYGAGAARGYFRPRHPRDWDRLAAAFGRKKRSLAEAEAVFYKGQGRQRIRAGGLLSTLSDDEYAESASSSWTRQR